MATTELKVGAFVLASTVLVIGGYFWAVDGLLKPGETAYNVRLTVPNADGVYAGTAVRIAGVGIGSIDTITLEGDQARIDLKILSQYPLPTDSYAELGSSGLLGDRYVRVTLGEESATIPDGGVIAYGEEPGNIDNITRQVEAISEDVKEITGVLREEVTNQENRDHVNATIANIDALSAELRLMAEQNRQDVAAIVDSVRRLSTNLEGITSETGRDVDEELDKIKDATDSLQRTLDDVESITGKVDDGQGTIGALVNDRETVDALNETIDNANSVIESFSGLHAEVYYTGRYYFGSEPADTETFFYGNPLSGSAANTIGLELHPQEDFWWVFEINDYPQGLISAQEKYYPETGYHYVEWTRELNYRFTFQMAKRWRGLGFRLGIKEGGGGLGMTVYAARSRLMLNADVFDFTFGSYPALTSVTGQQSPYGGSMPNVRLGARYEPIPHLYFEVGTEQLVLGLQNGFATGYGGVGFHFTDDDIKLLMATLPIGL